jgi:hypothetical protein
MIAPDNFDIFPASKEFAKPNSINTQSNVIAGPNTKPWVPRMMYWNDSPPGLTPMEREEGPFPVQGNVGQLVKDETNNYTKCGNSYDISGSRNCNTYFDADHFTPSYTCGSNCVLSAPESFGDKDFGLEQTATKYTNAHGIHAYQNIRAGAGGQSSQSGCYEFIPNTGKTSTGTCMLDPNPQYDQVGNWTKLAENKSIVSSSFNPNPTFK